MKKKNEATKPESKIDWVLRIKKQAEEYYKSGQSDMYGMCPGCFEAGEKFGNTYLNVNRNHFFYCDKHRVFWPVGSNLFSSWREQTEEDWERNISQLKNYTLINEWYPHDMFNLSTTKELEIKIETLKEENGRLKHQLEEIAKITKWTCPHKECQAEGGGCLLEPS